MISLGIVTENLGITVVTKKVLKK